MTAAADLQMRCANAAVRSGGIDAVSVLPLSSRRLEAVRSSSTCWQHGKLRRWRRWPHPLARGNL